VNPPALAVRDGTRRGRLLSWLTRLHFPTLWVSKRILPFGMSILHGIIFTDEDSLPKIALVPASMWQFCLHSKSERLPK